MTTIDDRDATEIAPLAADGVFLADLVHRYLDLLDVDDVAILLNDDEDTLHLAAASSDREWSDVAPAVHQLPLRVRERTLGVVSLVRTAQGALSDTQLAIARALTDTAAAAIVQHRAERDARLVVRQLEAALESRVAIEQAKGMVGQQAGLDMGAAFAAIRQYARNNNAKLTDVATALIERRLAPGAQA